MYCYVCKCVQFLSYSMAPPRAESHKRKKTNGREIGVFLTDLHHSLQARSSNHFLWFPHTPKAPRPLKRPKHFNLLLTFLKFYFWGLLVRAHLGYAYTSRTGAIIKLVSLILHFLLLYASVKGRPSNYKLGSLLVTFQARNCRRQAKANHARLERSQHCCWRRMRTSSRRHCGGWKPGGEYT